MRRRQNEKHIITVARVYVASNWEVAEIRTAQDLVNINQKLSGNYVLKDNIDLADFGEWTPIGAD